MAAGRGAIVSLHTAHRGILGFLVEAAAAGGDELCEGAGWCRGAAGSRRGEPEVESTFVGEDGRVLAT
jgi:hypothetical protein